MKNGGLTTVTYLILGIVAGVISFYIKDSLSSLGIAIFLMLICYYVLKKLLKSEEKFSWFISNGGWIYIFIWFITWTILYNVI